MLSAMNPTKAPIRLVLNDDLARGRLTVFFRLIIAIPFFIWLGLWSVLALFAWPRQLDARQ